MALFKQTLIFKGDLYGNYWLYLPDPYDIDWSW